MNCNFLSGIPVTTVNIIKKTGKMKKYIILIAAILIICESFTLPANKEISTGSISISPADTNDNRTIIIGNDFFRIDENDSSLALKIGNRGLSILESLEGKKVDIMKYETAPESDQVSQHHQEPDMKNDEINEDWDEDDKHEHGSFMRARNFRGHWAGIEAGFNGYRHGSSTVLPGQIEYMSLETNNSVCFNLNISQLNIGLSRHVGIVTGLGLNWNNYRFEHKNSIIVAGDGEVSEYIPASLVPVKRSKFSTLYLNVPVLLEIQIPAGFSSSLNIAGGVIGGIKLNAWTKVLFEDGEKSRINGDYNLNLLRGGLTARVGYRNFVIYGTYYLTPWFQESMGPGGYNLEPYEIGLAFTFND
jgi:hypothetical protein